jgi:hypothetical protein
VTPLWQALSQTEQGLGVVERLAASGRICVLGMTVRGELPAAATVKAEGDALVLNGQWSQVGRSMPMCSCCPPRCLAARWACWKCRQG